MFGQKIHFCPGEKQRGSVVRPEPPCVFDFQQRLVVAARSLFAPSWSVASDVAAVVAFVLEVEVCASDDFTLSAAGECVVVSLVDGSDT